MVDLYTIAGNTLAGSQASLTLVDMQHPSQPLIFVNDAFTVTTGYTLAETVGKNCRFLQGPGTDPAAVKAIREGIADGRRVTVDILNYRKDGSPFTNRLKLYPLTDDRDRLVAYCGVQIDLSIADIQRREEEADLLADMLVGKAH